VIIGAPRKRVWIGAGPPQLRWLGGTWPRTWYGLEAEVRCLLTHQLPEAVGGLGAAPFNVLVRSFWLKKAHGMEVECPKCHHKFSPA